MVKSTRPAPPLPSITPHRPSAVRPRPAKPPCRPPRAQFPLPPIDFSSLSMEPRPQPTRLQSSPSLHSCSPSDNTPPHLLPHLAELYPSSSHVNINEDEDEDEDKDAEYQSVSIQRSSGSFSQDICSVREDECEVQEFENGRQRLQHHWFQVGGKVMIPETWGREQHLQDWVSFGLVEDALRPAGLAFARTALIAECQTRGNTAASRASTGAGGPAPLFNRSADVEVS